MDGSSPCREAASMLSYVLVVLAEEAEEVEVDIASLRLRHTERRGASLLTAIPALIISLFGRKNARQTVVREKSARSSSCGSGSSSAMALGSSSRREKMNLDY